MDSTRLFKFWEQRQSVWALLSLALCFLFSDSGLHHLLHQTRLLVIVNETFTQQPCFASRLCLLTNSLSCLSPDTLLSLRILFYKSLLKCFLLCICKKVKFWIIFILTKRKALHCTFKASHVQHWYQWSRSISTSTTTSSSLQEAFSLNDYQIQVVLIYQKHILESHFTTVLISWWTIITIRNPLQLSESVQWISIMVWGQACLS